MAQKSPVRSAPNVAPSPDSSATSPHTGRCSVCKAATVAALHPFCSRRCADVDLARWLGGGYVIPDSGLDGDEDDEQIARPTTDSSDADG